MITRRGLVGGALSLGAAAVAGTARAQWVAPEAPTATVRVDRTPIAEIATGAFGVAVPFWRRQPAEHTGFELLGKAQVKFLAFDSGMAVDLYDWRTNRLKKDPQNGRRFMSYEERLQPLYSFDVFAKQAQSIGADMMVYANYGTGTPEEAAAWVQYANKEKHYGVRYWEVGQCLWGNGHFPEIGHEPDGHPDKSPEAYARNVVEFARAMKAVDPTIKVGMGIAPAYFKRFPERYADFVRWNEAVLDIAGAHVDFVDAFFYPGPRTQLTDADMLAAPLDNRSDLAALRAQVAKRETGSRKIELIMGECNSASGAHTQQLGQAGALFLADHFMSMYALGFDRVLWYAMYSGIQGGALRGHGDLGMFSGGDCSWDVTAASSRVSAYCQPPAHTPFRTYDGMDMLGRIAQPQGKLLAVTSSDASVGAHAVQLPDRSIAVLFVNKDGVAGRTVALDLGQGNWRDEAMIHYYGPASRFVESWKVDFGQLAKRPLILQPFSLTALVVKPA